MQTTSSILMIRPVNFAFNEQTASSNAFMNQLTKSQPVHHNALQEFDTFVEVLKRNEIEVLVIEDKPEPQTPDSIFPNNWISTHTDGTLVLYPMQAPNRRLERRQDIIDEISTRFGIKHIIDLSYFEKEEKYLEGTGSMVFDRDYKVVYACISPRTNKEVLQTFCNKTGYQAITFNAYANGQAIYHTNVMMCIGTYFAVICLNSITDKLERELVNYSLQKLGKEIIDISMDQLQHFAGNMIELTNKHNQNILVMSEQAYKSITANQFFQLQKYCKVVFSPLGHIEAVGGGSARCMIAEIFLPPNLNYFPVSICGASTGFDSGEPFCRK